MICNLSVIWGLKSILQRLIVAPCEEACVRVIFSAFGSPSDSATHWGRKEGRKGWGNLGHSSVKGEGRGGCKGIFLAGWFGTVAPSTNLNIWSILS